MESAGSGSAKLSKAENSESAPPRFTRLCAGGKGVENEMYFVRKILSLLFCSPDHRAIFPGLT